jgi:hypothetical protein
VPNQTRELPTVAIPVPLAAYPASPGNGAGSEAPAISFQLCPPSAVDIRRNLPFTGSENAMPFLESQNAIPSKKTPGARLA